MRERIDRCAKLKLKFLFWAGTIKRMKRRGTEHDQIFGTELSVKNYYSKYANKHRHKYTQYTKNY